MKKEIKAKWVAALRIGKYKQAQGRLKNEEGFCCLGVLCDLHSKEGTETWKEDSYIYSTAALPQLVKDWAGIRNPNGGFVTLKEERKTLSHHNDQGKTFLEIADAIESQL